MQSVYCANSTKIIITSMAIAQNEHDNSRCIVMNYFDEAKSM